MVFALLAEEKAARKLDRSRKGKGVAQVRDAVDLAPAPAGRGAAPAADRLKQRSGAAEGRSLPFSQNSGCGFWANLFRKFAANLMKISTFFKDFQNAFHGERPSAERERRVCRRRKRRNKNQATQESVTAHHSTQVSRRTSI